MFFDSLGHTMKDMVIMLLIVFTFVLSVFIFVMNSSLDWWEKNSSNVSQDDKNKHGTNTAATALASIFVSIIGLIILYAIYEFYTKGKIVGLNKYGRKLR